MKMTDTDRHEAEINRKVYVAIQSHINYERGIQLGTYSTLEKAQSVALDYVKESGGRVYYDINIYEVCVNERPTDDGGWYEIGELVWYWHAKSNKGVFQR